MPAHIVVWDLETVPDLRGFPNNGCVGAIDIAPYFTGIYAQDNALLDKTDTTLGYRWVTLSCVVERGVSSRVATLWRERAHHQIQLGVPS